jgi:hypothetical protein
MQQNKLKDFTLFKIFKEKEKPFLTFKRAHLSTLLAGVLLNAVFFIIYIIISIKTGEVNFYSFFYHNMKNHVFLTILSGFHVSLLGFGILIILISFFNITLYVKCYNNRFIVSMYLQKSLTIEFSKIDRISVKLFYLNYENLFQKYEKKECRVFIHNAEHIFYFSYPVKGYFDDMEINLKKNKENMDERCVADRESIIKILQLLKNKFNLIIPYLPEESRETVNDHN